MTAHKFPLSRKYRDFIRSVQGVTAEFLEGTTASGKTTVGAGVKFMYMVSASPKRLHIIAAKTTGIAEKNIIQQENGILDLHRNAVYCGNGDRNNKLPHIKFEGKLIYVLGYDNKDKWENVLGSQFGCVYIDEINTADIDFVREISTRNDYLLATLNPDDPSLPVYREFVNRSRPCAKYAADVPEEILRELTEEPVTGWRYWFFSFRDNLSLTEADIQRKMDAAPKGTKLYKNKILGLRGRATGLVFDLQQRHIITASQAAGHRFLYYSIGCDTSYSRKSHDRLTFEAVGITADRKCILLMEETHNNRDKSNPFAPSDVIPVCRTGEVPVRLCKNDLHRFRRCRHHTRGTEVQTQDRLHLRLCRCMEKDEDHHPNPVAAELAENGGLSGGGHLQGLHRRDEHLQL